MSSEAKELGMFCAFVGACVFIICFAIHQNHSTYLGRDQVRHDIQATLRAGAMVSREFEYRLEARK